MRPNPSTAESLAAMTELSAAITQQMAQLTGEASQPSQEAGVVSYEKPQVHGPRVVVSPTSGMVATAAQGQQHVDDLVRRHTAKTARSKQLAQRYRGVLADSRARVGFRHSTKEMHYPIAGARGHGSRLEDVDGNSYVDITMGFGILLFGHEPEFVTEAARAHLASGIRLGPRGPETGEAAELLSELTGMQRVAFANSGTEANSAAIRLARAATGRAKIVMFHGSYHGHADNVLGRSIGVGAERETVPVSTGIPSSAVTDLIVLDYGAPESLRVIEELADEIAAVLVEPVQSRNPSLRPVEFVRSLREITRQRGIVLLFDEMLTGFRPHLRGAQELYGVSPDLATYGKLLGGGYPIGAIAGRADIMDGVDGGFWRYGDDSYPAADTTFFGGTYIQHPLSMAAAGAVLRHLKNHSPQLQIDVNRRTDWLAESVNQFCVAEEFPLQVAHFGSMFRFEHRANMELLYHHLMLRGVYIWEWRNFFLSTAHGDDDVEFIANAVRESLRELRRAGFFPGSNRTAAAGVPKPAGVEPTATESAGVSQARPTAAAQPAAGAQPAPAATVRPASVAQPAAAAARHSAPDLSLYFFGDYPRGTDPAASYELIADAAQFADQHGFHAVWLPERHFHSFGGAFPNPAVLAAGLARETRQIRLNAGSVVLPLHDVIRVAEEWAMVDNLSGGRVGIGCASGWNTQDFVFFPDRFARRKELMYEQVAQLRALWRGDPLRRVIADAGPGAGRAAGRGAPGANGVFSSNGTAGSNGGYGSNGRPGDPAPAEADIRLFPRPVQAMPPMFTAIVGNPDSYRQAARHDLGVVTNLMSQTTEQLAQNIDCYRRTRAEHGLDPDAGRVVVLLHTYLGEDHAAARRAAYRPLSRYMRSSLSLFGQVTGSLGHNVDLSSLTEADLDAVFSRAYDRYCDQRALIGAPEHCLRVIDTLRQIGVDEVAALVDFGVTPDQLRAGLPHLDRLRQLTRRTQPAPQPQQAQVAQQAHPRQAAPEPAPEPERGHAREPAHAPRAVTPSSAPAVAAAVGDGAAASEPFPLTPGQLRMWTLERLAPNRSTYHEAIAMRLEGPLDIPALRAALIAVTRHHEALRTVFPETDAGSPQQMVRAEAAPELVLKDRTGAAEADVVRQAMEAEAARDYNLQTGPLFVTTLTRLGQHTHLMVLGFHHIVIDAVSAGILARDLSTCYRAALRGETPQLPPASGSWREVARAQAAVGDSDPKIVADLAYWRKVLGEDLPVLDLPTDRPRPELITSHGNSLFGDVPAELAEELRRLSQRRRSTLFMTLLAGYAAMLHRASGQTDIVIGAPVTERPDGAEELVGCFLNTIALRLDLSGDPSFEELLRRVRGQALDGYDHADAPFDSVVRALSPPRDASRTPIFQVLAEYEGDEQFPLDLPQLRVTPLRAAAPRAVTDLTVYFMAGPDGIACRLEHNADLFDVATAQSFFDCFQDVLRAVARDPGIRLSELPAPLPAPLLAPLPAPPEGAQPPAPGPGRATFRGS